MTVPGNPAPILLPTSVIGSYSVPQWLGQVKNDFYRHRISRRTFDEIHETAIKAAVLDQERAGIDTISDGELRRDNDVDYLIAAIPGVDIPRRDKADYFDYFDAAVHAPLPAPPLPGSPPAPGPPPGTVCQSLGLAADFRFVRQLTDRPVKLSLTGPYSLARRIRNEGAYPGIPDLVRALARVLAAEAADLQRAGARVLQIDEPLLAGYPEDAGLAVEAVNIVTAGAPDVTWILHVCYGNRYARPLWEGHYDFLFPAVREACVSQLALEFARTGDADLSLISAHHWDRGLGLGVIDVKSGQVESAAQVAERIRRALRVVPPDRLMVNPDCGLRHLPPPVARAKLAAMVAGAALVRSEISSPPAPARPPAPAGPPAPAERTTP